MLIDTVLKKYLPYIKYLIFRNKFRSLNALLIIFLYYYRNLFNKRNLIDFLLKVPYLGAYIGNEMRKNTLMIQNDINNGMTYQTAFPEYSHTLEEVCNKINTHNSEHDNDKISGIVYYKDDTYNQDLLKLYSDYCQQNPLHPNIFPQIRQMEIETINMMSKLYGGGEECCGNITYGGTESILLACYTYREWGRMKRGIYHPNIVAPESIHPAFDKACYYFGIRLQKIPLNSSYTVSASDIKKYINNNTILVTASAPNYAHGIIDPISQIGKICHQYQVGFHVDCCMGGFIVPFINSPETNQVNFMTQGVTSISMDSHKYGYCHKGSSILLMKNRELKQFQHYINTGWNGGIYCTPTLMGSKSGGLISTVWGALHLNGREKYTLYAKEIIENLRLIKEEFRNNTLIDIIGVPSLNIIAFKSKAINIYHVIDEMKKKHWDLSVLQNPPAFHLCLTRCHTREITEKFISDLRSSISIAKNNPSKLSGTLSLYGSSQSIENSLFTGDLVNNFVTLLSSEKIY